MSEDEDDDPQQDCLLLKAFHIEAKHRVKDDDDISDDPNLPPTSGKEYLRRVQLEYRQCPKIVVADIDTSQFLGNRTVKIDQSAKSCLPAPEGYAASVEWQTQQVAFFSDIRHKIVLHKFQAKLSGSKIKSPVPLPKADDDVGWCRLCFGNSASSKEVNVGVSPLASLVCSISQPVLEQVLTYHVSWMEVAGFSAHQGRWFYALLSCLEKPLTPEACSTLRSLARVCATLRVALPSKDDPFLIPLNLIITLVSRYFDQKDMAD